MHIHIPLLLQIEPTTELVCLAQDSLQDVAVQKVDLLDIGPLLLTEAHNLFRLEVAVIEVEVQRLDPGRGVVETRSEALEQLVLDSIASGATARGDPNLAIDRRQVGVDGAGTDHELLGDLLTRQPACD